MICEQTADPFEGDLQSSKEITFGRIFRICRYLIADPPQPWTDEGHKVVSVAGRSASGWTDQRSRPYRTSKLSKRSLTHIALSPKEIGAEPGGTPSTFWLPV